MYACHCCLVHTEVIKQRLTSFFFSFFLSRSTVPLRTQTRCMARPIWNTCKTSLVPHTLLAFKHAYENGTGFCTICTSQHEVPVFSLSCSLLPRFIVENKITVRRIIMIFNSFFFALCIIYCCFSYGTCTSYFVCVYIYMHCSYVYMYYFHEHYYL